MCGIAGIISTCHELRPRLEGAARVQLHRGPNASKQDLYHVNPWTVGFAHQRLSIIDLSESANQPMASPGGRQILIYNGEVYNYQELRIELEAQGVRFHTRSDTEVVLEAIRTWGCQAAFQRFNGMWALAFLDLEAKKVILSRDRMGIKPLYVCFDGRELVFASEIKAILQACDRKFGINTRVATHFLTQSLLDVDDETFFLGIEKLPAAHFATVDLSQGLLALELERFWSLPIDDGNCAPIEETAEQLRITFFDSVRIHLRSDVPVGILLSGGLDSSSIAAAAHQILGSQNNLNLISAVSTDTRFDESPHIDIMSSFLRVPATKVVLDFTSYRALELLDKVTWFNDEPIGSFSTAAHYLLMERAKELGVTVVLSGQGGDELMAGYRKYLGFYAQWLCRKHDYVLAARVVLDSWRRGTTARQFSVAESKRYLPFLGWITRDLRGSALIESQTPPVRMGLGQSVTERQAEDVTRLSVPVLLHYEDRMSMAASREIRVPLLDYRLVETLVPLSPKFKIHNGWSKWIFRKTMEPFLPKEIVWRKDKQGFINPQSEWLKNELRGSVENLFSPDALIFKRKLVQREALTNIYRQFCNQPAEKGTIWFKDVFNSVALELWLRRFDRWLKN